MKSIELIRGLFTIAAIYDGVLGVAFLVAGPWLYGMFEVTPPNHWGYVQFPAALLIVFALMFGAIALRPEARRELIVYGMLLKVSYCGVTLSHWLSAGIPGMWQPFVVCDALFLVLFGWAWIVLGRVGTAKG